MTFQGIVLFVLIMLFVVLLLDMLFPDHQKALLDRIEGMKLYNAPEKDRKMNESLFARIYEATEKKFLIYFGDKLAASGSMNSLKGKLIRAGEVDTDPLQHRAKRIIFAFAFAGVALMTKDIRIITLAAAIGAYYPDYSLKNKITERETKIKEGIPDFLDLLAAIFPGSDGLEDAIKRIVKRSDSNNIIVHEFQRMIEEINAGKRKKEALRDLADRCGVKEIDTLVTQIIQSEALGTPMAETLKNQAGRMRELKKQLAEIKARKASITLLLPTVFLLLAIVIVIVGPSIVQLMASMGNM